MKTTLSGGFAGETRPSGLDQVTLIERLPLLRPDVQVHYEGSIDKQVGNADWDWWLYQDTNTQEWVICEADGPGCLWNFVVHHAVGHSDPVYRFYVDGNRSPAFEIRHSEFGRWAPFVAPLADKFIPLVEMDARLKAIDFQIVQSFCPMQFCRSLRITSSVQLIGNHETGGGWGHAIWHSYPTAEGLRSFTGREDISDLLGLWRNLGEDPKSRAGVQPIPFQGTVPRHGSRSLLDLAGKGSLSAIRLLLEPATPATLSNLWLRLTWDGEARPAVECPVGAFFGNEFGKNRLQTLWLEDEFMIPPAYTRGKQKIVVRIEPEPVDERQTLNWNESAYSVFSLGVTKEMP